MIKLYTVTFTQDKETYHNVTIPARNVSDAYVEVLKDFEGAEITDLKLSGKVISINSEAWLDVFAKYLVKHAKLKEITDVMDELATEDARDELVEAIWKQYHK